MEVIQEYSENRYYLNALSTCARVECLFAIADVTPEQCEAMKQTETPQGLFQEPLGQLFFRFHIVETQNLEISLCLDEMEEYDNLPETSFRTRRAKALIHKFIQADARQRVPLHPATREAILTTFEKKGGCVGLFASAKQSLSWHMRLTCFRSFLSSRYYARFLSFRIHGLRPISMDDFEYLRVLGEGGFGQVFAVSKRDTRAVYACKTMNKAKIIERQREKLIINERHILAQVHHPFIVNLKYAFQDAQALHLILDLMSGGELQFHLNRLGALQESWVRFYAAGLVLAIGHLHQRRIVYRDLKPENVMLDADGHIRLTDLGLCSVIQPDQKLHRHCGTRSYMAPEQCYGPEGYDQMVDWWSLGVTIIHLLTGKNPFAMRNRRTSQPTTQPRRRSVVDMIMGRPADEEAGEKEEQEPTDKEERRLWQIRKLQELCTEYTTILQKIEWPSNTSPACRTFVNALCELDPIKRIGRNLQEVQGHAWFHGLDWHRLQERHISPPFQPDSNYVNAEYLEATVVGLARSSKVSRGIEETVFHGFEYIAPTVFQDEVLATVHDKMGMALGPKHQRNSTIDKLPTER